MGLFHRAERRSDPEAAGTKTEKNGLERANLPAGEGDPNIVVGPEVRVNRNGHKVTKGIQPDGESGRAGIHPFHFLRICFRSTSNMSRLVNVLWPVVPVSTNRMVLDDYMKDETDWTP